MSLETPRTSQSEFIIPPAPEVQDLLPERTETQPVEQEMISLPEELKTPELQEAIEARGLDANKVHVDLGRQAIAHQRILEGNRQFEQASAVAVRRRKILGRV